RQPRAQCFKFAQRQLRRGAVRQAKRGRVVEGLAGGGKPRRVALVEQRCDLLGIELGRRWGGLLRRSRRRGVSLLRLGLLGFVLRQRVGDRIGLRLGLLFFRLGLGGLGFRRRRRLARGLDFLLFHHLRGGVFDRVRLCDLFDQGLCRLGFRRVLAAGRDLGEIGRGHEVDRQALSRRHRKRRGRE